MPSMSAISSRLYCSMRGSIELGAGAGGTVDCAAATRHEQAMAATVTQRAADLVRMRDLSSDARKIPQPTA